MLQYLAICLAMHRPVQLPLAVSFALLLSVMSLLSPLLLLVHVCGAASIDERPSSFAVQLPEVSDDTVARDLAARHGYNFITKVGESVCVCV